MKNVAVVDELSAAAELLMGQAAEARSVVVLKGLSNVVARCSERSIGELWISGEDDLFKEAL